MAPHGSVEQGKGFALGRNGGSAKPGDGSERPSKGEQCKGTAEQLRAEQGHGNEERVSA